MAAAGRPATASPPWRLAAVQRREVRVEVREHRAAPRTAPERTAARRCRPRVDRPGIVQVRRPVVAHQPHLPPAEPVGPRQRLRRRRIPVRLRPVEQLALQVAPIADRPRPRPALDPDLAQRTVAVMA